MVAGFGYGRYKQFMAMAQESAESGDTIEVSLASPIETHEFAARLAPYAGLGDTIALSGDLGTGKTTFARGFINALLAQNGLPPEDVPSPTFTLIQEYQLPQFMLYHIDLYRIEEESELIELGLEDAFADGLSLVEWPDRLGSLLPASRLDVVFEQGARDGRLLHLSVFGNWKGRFQAGALNG